MSPTLHSFFMTFAMAVGLCLFILSFYLIPLVEDSTYRSQIATKSIQILGVVIFCISGCALSSKNDNKNIPVFLILLLGLVTTFLSSIIYNDSEDARKYIQYLLASSVVMILFSLFIILQSQNKSKSIDIDEITFQPQFVKEVGKKLNISPKSVKRVQTY